MARLNTSATRPQIYTHEGAVAQHINPEQQLRRLVMASLLWEDQFYLDGVSHADLLSQTIPTVAPEKVAQIAIEAREKQKLRHVPLKIVREMLRHPKHKLLVADTLARVIQRPDELAEFLMIYDPRYGKGAGSNRSPLPAQARKGLAKAFPKFGAYSLAKYNRDGGVKLRDVLFLAHPKPKDEEQAAVWKKLVDGTLEPPDTWEVKLSGGQDKKETFERLMAEKKLGALACLRNLRNMAEAGINKSVVSGYLSAVEIGRVLPFRFVAAARACAQWEDVIEPAFLRVASQHKLPGKTVLIIDVSGSMYAGGNISARSDMTRVDAAGALAAIARETCEDVSIYATAGSDSSRIHATSLVPSRRGFALVDLFSKRGFASTLGGGGIFLTQCLDFVKAREKTADRIIVLTDEQDCDVKLTPAKADAFGRFNYLINLASYRNGIGYGKWIHIDGWSEAVLEFVIAHETDAQ